MRLKLRVVLTEKCNASCPHCFNAMARHGKEMDASLLIKFMRLNKKHAANGGYLIMGGEPTLHPRINDVLFEAVKAGGFARLFTNGNTLDDLFSNKMLLTLHRKGKLWLAINAYAFDFRKLRAYQKFLNPKYMNFYLVVPMEGASANRTMQKILTAGSNFRITISPDTTINLFDERSADRYRKTWMNFLIKNRTTIKTGSVRQDHHLPFCFYTREMLQKLGENDLGMFAVNSCGCTEHLNIVLGLIQTNFDLYFCNQTRIKLGSLLKDNELIPYEEILKMLSKAPDKKKEAILKTHRKCKSCPSLDMCLQGCYFNASI